MEVEGVLPFSQDSATVPYPEPYFNVHFNIIPSTPSSPKCSLLLHSVTEMFLYISHPSHAFSVSRLSHYARFDYTNNIWYTIAAWTG